MSIKTVNSPVFFVDNSGEAYNFAGIEYKEAAVASPLVEDGSGQGLGHPETTRKMAVQTTISAVVPAFKFDPQDVTNTLVIAPRKTKLKFGDAIISTKSAVAKSGLLVLERWTSLNAGKVVSEPTINYNDITSMLSIKVDCLEIMEGDAEKFRGFGKFRSNGGFLKNIAITTADGCVVFNPQTALKDAEGNLLQVEHVVGGEEYKTLNYVIGLLADQMAEGQAVWDAAMGKWENEAELISLVETQMTRVVVRRWNYEQTVYEMLKAMYGNHPDFAFDDSNNQVTHSNVMAWIGNQVQIIEVPLTRTFVGKCPLFAEHIATLGMEFPQLYKVLLNDVAKNQKMIAAALDLAEGIVPGATEENPYGNCIIIDNQTMVVDGEKSTLDLARQEDGSTILNNLIVSGDYDLDLLSKLDRMITKAGFAGFVIEAFNEDDECCVFALNLATFRLLTGSASHKLIRTLVQLFVHLETPNGDDRNYDNWENEFYRLAMMLKAGLEIAVADSNSLIAKATKTTAIAFTCRVGGSMDADVKLDEFHIHPELAEFWGLQSGDIIVPGRVPVPGMGVLNLVLNSEVPMGTAIYPSCIQHALQEGDKIIDSLVTLCCEAK